jgi:hypothetical protein
MMFLLPSYLASGKKVMMAGGINWTVHPSIRAMRYQRIHTMRPDV